MLWLLSDPPGFTCCFYCNNFPISLITFIPDKIYKCVARPILEGFLKKQSYKVQILSAIKKLFARNIFFLDLPVIVSWIASRKLMGEFLLCDRYLLYF